MVRPMNGSVAPKRRPTMDMNRMPEISSLSMPMRAVMRRIYYIAECMVCLKERYGCPSRAPDSDVIIFKMSHYFCQVQMHIRQMGLSERDLLSAIDKADLTEIIRPLSGSGAFYKFLRDRSVGKLRDW